MRAVPQLFLRALRWLPALSALAGVAMAQTVYRSVDDQGNVTYTDRPPLQIDASQDQVEALSLQVPQPATTVVRAQADTSTVTADAGQPATDSDRQAQLKAQRQANCETARERASKYAQARRIYRDLGDGEREYLSDDELDAEREHAVRAVDEWCDD